jgi:hypothetical protein
MFAEICFGFLRIPSDYHSGKYTLYLAVQTV